MVVPILSSDINRPPLESRISRMQHELIIPDSLKKLEYNPWASGEIPRIMLIVPPYTRIRRPIDVVMDNIERDEKSTGNLSAYRELASVLRDAGMSHLEEMKRAGVPMGLLRVGTAAKKAGYDVRIIDGVYEGWNNERSYFTTKEGSEVISYGLPKRSIIRRIKEYNPHVVGISIDYTHQWGNARELTDLVKQLDERTIVVVGGTHANGLPEDVLYDSPSDFVVRGQADVTFPELLDTLTQRVQRNVEDVQGIAFRKNGKVIYTNKRPFMSSIDDIAIPDLSLVNLNLYSGPYHSAGKRTTDDGFLTYGFTSIGCNTGCDFCAIPGAQGPWVPMTGKKLGEYLDYIVARGVREFIVEDDHLFHSPEWALTVFSELEKRHLPWVEEGGVGLFNLIALLESVDRNFILQSIGNKAVFRKTLEAKERGITAEHLIERMAESGCYSLYLAVESANKDSLGTSHKPTLNATQEHTAEIVELFRKYGIDATCGLMLGFINPESFVQIRGTSRATDSIYVESVNQIRKTISYGRFLRDAGASYINPFIFTPLPGAPHFDSLKKYAFPNTDEGFSHEFATIDAPNGAWTRDALNLLRADAIIKTVGLEGYRQILRTGTWPVNS